MTASALIRPLRGLLKAAPLLLLLGARSAVSLPLFARELDVSCSHCHSAASRLNATGIAFAQNGYRLVGAHTAQSGQLRVSLVGSTDLTVTHDKHELPRIATLQANLLNDRALGAHTAGVVRDRLSYRFGISRESSHADDPRGIGFLQLDDVLKHGALNLRAGRFDVGLPWLSQARRTTLAEYLSPTRFDARGVELNGTRSAWTYAAGASFSDRHLAGGASPHRIAPPFEDSYFRLQRRLGAGNVGAQFLFDRQDSHLRTLSWLQHMQCELSASLGQPRFSIVPAYVFDRFDDRPSAGLHERHQYYLVETPALLDASGHWELTARYEHEYRTRNAYEPSEHRDLEAVDLAWQARDNARIGTEWARADVRGVRGARNELAAFVQASW